MNQLVLTYFMRGIHRLLTYAVLAVAIPVKAAPGYLPVVGPPAPRFAVPPPAPLASGIALPPLSSAESPPVIPVVESPTVSNSPVSVEVAAASPSAVSFEPLIPSLFAVPSEPSSTNLMASNPEIPGSQMLLKYFTGRPGTNSGGVSFYAPVSFVPPLPAPPPSSSATFQVVPSGQP